MSGDIETILKRARLANTELTVVSPNRALLPRFEADPVGGNKESKQLITGRDEIMYWVVIDPLKPETYEQADKMLSNPECAGIKIHPEEHGYPINNHGEKIFTFAAEHKSIVMTHSSEQNSLADDFVKFADDFPEITLILAHLGWGWDGNPDHQVRAIQKSKHGNIFTDTSSLTNIFPNQVEWGVREIGAEKILYGTDSPSYFAPAQRARIDNADMSDKDKKLILRDNSLKLLKR